MKKDLHVHPNTEKITAGSHPSYWVNSIEPLGFRKLEKDLETDVVIVGGGLAGVSVAYNLIRSGKRVVLLEDGYIGSGETGRTTAHLVTALDDRYYELERIFGEEKTKLIAESHKSAIDFIEKTIRHEHINCNFERVDGYLFLHSTDEINSLQKEYEAAGRAGLDVEILGYIPGMEKNHGASLRFINQAQFHPLKYLKGLSQVVHENGGLIFTNTHVNGIDKTGVTTDEGFKVSAKHIVIATNTPINNMVVMHLKQYPYRSYVIGAKIKKDSLPINLWWDTGDFSANKEIPLTIM